MKKGISLIVLVITIIVLAILAAAIIMSLNDTNIITETTQTRIDADLANAKNAVTLAYANGLARGISAGVATGKSYSELPQLDDAGQIVDKGTVMTDDDYYAAIEAAFGKEAGWGAKNYTITVDTVTGNPTSVTAKAVATN